MKPLAVLLLIIGNVVAAQAFAGDVSPEPLTRVDCNKVAMDWSWNENANKCESTFEEAEAKPESQPLTRKECDLAGMKWNDTANVCGEKSARSATPAQSDPPNPVSSKILINIDKTSQTVTVFLDGVERYHWPTSTGRAGYSTPSGTFTPTSMNEIWYSKQWDNSPMPHAIFFMKDGHAIHGSYEVKHLGKPVSHGCVRIAPQNATILYDLVKRSGMQNTQVVLSGETPGGEGKVAARSKSRVTPHYHYYVESYVQRQRRGGFFRRFFGGP